MGSILHTIKFAFMSAIAEDAVSAGSTADPSNPLSGILSGESTNPLSGILSGESTNPLSGISSGNQTNPLSGISAGNVTDTISGIASGKISDTFQTVESILMIISRIGSVLLALLLCFTGYRRVRQWVSFVAFVFGAVLGYSAATALGLGKDYWYLPLIIALAAGIILSLLGYRIFQLGLFVFCGAVASWAVTAHVLPKSLTGAQQGSMYYVLIGIQVIVFVAGGVLAVRFARTAIIFISSIGGARVASAGLAELLPKYFPDSSRQLILFAGLALLGILIQFLTTKPDTKRRRSRDWE